MNTQQLEYYRQTAGSYDDLHLGEPEHAAALKLITVFARAGNYRSVLDVGCGTGRAMLCLQSALPEATIKGIDPSEDLIRMAVERNGIDPFNLQVGDGGNLPFESGSFDATVATGVLHHVEDPSRIIQEMSRVSRNAIFISDTNMYGRGRLLFRAAKTFGRALGVVSWMQWVRHGGTHWITSEGDGVSRAYSVLDSLGQLESLFDTVYVIPTSGSRRMRTIPILAASHIVAICVRESCQSQDVEQYNNRDLETGT